MSPILYTIKPGDTLFKIEKMLEYKLPTFFQYFFIITVLHY